MKMKGDYRLRISGGAVIDGVPVDDATIRASEGDEIRSDGPIAVDIEPLPESGDETGDAAAVLESVSGTSETAILDFLAVEEFGYSAETWAEERDVKEESIESNLRAVRREVESPRSRT